MLLMLVETMKDQAVDLSSVILKTSMVLTGKDTGHIDAPEVVAEHTLDVLLATMPKEVPGIVFLSGGQTVEQATDNLRALCTRAKEVGAPWPLTFSYSRALQHEALTAWQGKEDTLVQARALFVARLEKMREALG